MKACYEDWEGNAQPERIQRVIFQHGISLVLNKHALGGEEYAEGSFIK